jgi:hypothetical protein
MANPRTPVGPAQAPENIDDTAQYKITLKKSVTVGVTTLNRGSHIVVTGRVLKEIIASVESYVRA